MYIYYIICCAEISVWWYRHTCIYLLPVYYYYTWTAIVRATNDLVNNVIWVAWYQIVYCCCVWLNRQYLFIAEMANICSAVNTLCYLQIYRRICLVAHSPTAMRSIFQNVLFSFFTLFMLLGYQSLYVSMWKASLMYFVLEFQSRWMYRKIVNEF